MDGWHCAQSNCGGARCEKVELKLHYRRFLWLLRLSLSVSQSPHTECCGCHWTLNWKCKQLLNHPLPVAVDNIRLALGEKSLERFPCSTFNREYSIIYCSQCAAFD